jgi:hypothetical protein
MNKRDRSLLFILYIVSKYFFSTPDRIQASFYLTRTIFTVAE